MVKGAAHHHACAKRFHQMAGPIQSSHHRHRTDAAFKAAAGLSPDAQFAGCDAGLRSIKSRALKEDGLGILRDLTFQSTHDPGQTHGTLRIADHQFGASQGVYLAIQSCQLFTILRSAHDDLPSAHPAQIEGVHGMAGLQHHKIGDVHDIVDRPHAGGVQAAAQPHW